MSAGDFDWYGPEAATFGDRVAGAREHAGMTQGQLARRIGVKASTLRGWEEDLAEPRANKLTMLAGLLNVSVVWLLTGEGPGVNGPVETVPPADVNELLSELRDIRGEMRKCADRSAVLEKKLRAYLFSDQL